MKLSLLVCSLILSSHYTFAAISFNGTFASGLGAERPAGSLVLFLVDEGNDGFLKGSSFAGDLTAINDPKVDEHDFSTATTFGGDRIIYRGTAGSAGSFTFPLSSFDNFASTQSKPFAAVWFPTLTSTTSNALTGTKYGITRGIDWIMPSTDIGSYGSSTSDFSSLETFARVTVSSGIASNDLFTTSTGATFTIVPEPSVAVMSALASLALLRRRRSL